MQPDVLKSAKSADRKLVFVPILLILGRIWSLIRFLDVLVSNGTLHKQTITSADKVLLTLQVRYHFDIFRKPPNFSSKDIKSKEMSKEMSI